MKIYHIIQGINNVSAGPSYSVGAISQHLAARGNQVEVMAFGSRPAEWPFGTSLRIFDGGCERIGLAGWKAIRWIRSIAREAAILHGHSVWRVANLFPLLLNARTPARIVWSPRGTFSEWSWRYRAPLKRPFWHALQRPALRNVACFHATSIAEYEDVRRRGFVDPVAIIPNGVDIPRAMKRQPRSKKVVFLGRIHPVKGIDLLLPAWRGLAARFPDWNLIVAGPLDSAYAQKIACGANSGELPRVRFPGEVTGERKTALLHDAALIVLPSHSENFAMVVAEALAHGVPVVTTTGTPWREVVARNCGWYIEPTVEALHQAMAMAMSLPLEQLETMGQRGREWMTTDHDWPQLAARMADVYAWLLRGGSRPSCVAVD